MAQDDGVSIICPTQICASISVYRELQQMFDRIFGTWVQVRIMTGKDKGQQGTVVRVFRDKNRVLVEGQNLVSLTFMVCDSV